MKRKRTRGGGRGTWALAALTRRTATSPGNLIWPERVETYRNGHNFDCDVNVPNMDSQKGFNVMLLIDNGTEATFIFHRLGLLAAYNPAIKHWFADALLDHFARFVYGSVIGTVLVQCSRLPHRFGATHPERRGCRWR